MENLSPNVPVDFIAESEQAMDKIGAEIARHLQPGETVALIGTLGAGKTRLCQSIAVALGVARDQVVSPTFTLCNEYVGNDARVDHLDLYRIADEDELLELGFNEYCDSAHVTLVEWADRFPDLLPEDRVEVCIEVVGTNERQVRVTRRSA